MTAMQLTEAPDAHRVELPRASTNPPVSVADAASALQVLRHGGADDSTLEFELPPAVKATVSPTIAALRWTAVLFGILFGAARSADGDLAIVVTTTLVLFFTTWRSMLPLKLASHRKLHRIKPITDGAILGLAIGVSDGLASPYAFCLLAAATVASFGWGATSGTLSFIVGLVGIVITATLTGAAAEWTTQGAVGVVVATIVAILFASFARARLLDAERRRLALAGRVDTLAETNDLLSILNRVARTIPTALDLRDALNTTREQIHDAIAPDVLCILSTDDGTAFDAQVTDGCAFKPSTPRVELPAMLADAVDSGSIVRRNAIRGAGLDPESTSGIYAPLCTRDRVVGVLAVERIDEPFAESAATLLAGLTDVVALSIDNARRFGRLRTLGAEEERSRIARDLHDRIGQWLTYISFEVERLAADDESDELTRLHTDVQTAIDELRETLRSLRTSVTAERPFKEVVREVIDRFTSRREIEIELLVEGEDAALPVPVENELLRITQEALNNIDKHARASFVEILWRVEPHIATLRITDNGRGFDLQSGVRDTAYGLVGMRERADAIEAAIDIDSAPGEGTSVTVRVDRATVDDRRN